MAGVTVQNGQYVFTTGPPTPSVGWGGPGVQLPPVQVVNTPPPPVVVPVIPPDPVVVAPTQPPPPVNTTSGSGGGEVAQDWGDFLGGLAQTWIQGQVNPPAPVVAQPVSTGGGGYVTPSQGTLNVLAGDVADYMPGIPGFDVVQTGSAVAGMLYDAVKGKWVKRCRHRRRKLLTEADFTALAKLKTLTGNNDAFKVAVMKAVR